MFRFRNFKVFKDAKKFAALCEKIIGKIHGNNFEIIRQIRSAYLSIILNIAEGSACDSDKEFARFLEISLRSAHEVVAAFDLCLEIGLIDDIILSNIESEAESLCKQINGFRKSLKKLKVIS